MKCKSCGAEFTGEFKVCPNCGATTGNFSKDSIGTDSVESADAEDKDDGGWSYGTQHVEDFQQQGNDQSTKERIASATRQAWNGMDVFCKIVTVFACVVGILLIVSLVSCRALPIIISIVQCFGLVTALLMHKNIVIGKAWTKYLIITAVIFLSIVNVKSYSIVKNSSTTSLDRKMAKDEPEIKTIQMPFNAEAYINRDFVDIDSQLTECGFTDISYDNMEDLKVSESDRVGQVKSVTVDGKADFTKDQTFDKDAEIVIHYHGYAKSAVKIHVNFTENLIFSKYDVKFFLMGRKREHWHMGKMGILSFRLILGNIN